MTRTSLFSSSTPTRLRRKRDNSGRPGQSTHVSNSIHDLDQRREDRRSLPDIALSGHVTTYKSSTGKRRIYHFDFTPLVVAYPHHDMLVRQLLVGARLCLHGDRSSTTVERLYATITSFVRFVNTASWAPVTPVLTVADIAQDVVASFCTFLRQEYPQKSKPNWTYRFLRQMVDRLQAAHPNIPQIGKPIPWPAGPPRADNVLEGYRPETLDALAESCLQDITAIMATHERYDHLRLTDKYLRDDNISLENVSWWLRNASPSTARKHPNYVLTLKWYREFLARFGLSHEEFMAVYHEHGDELVSRGTNPFARMALVRTPTTDEQRVRNMDLVVATMANNHPRYPFQMPLDEISELYSKATLGSKAVGLLRDGWEAQLRCAFKGATTIRASHGLHGGLLGYLSYLHFTLDTIYPFFLMIQLQTGWNIEAILALPDDPTLYFRDVSPQLTALQEGIDQDSILMASLKQRGGGKVVYHKSHKGDKFGAYALLSHVTKVVTAYRDSPHYVQQTLWQCVSDPKGRRRGRLLLMPLTTAHLHDASRRFLARHIKANSTREGLEVFASNGVTRGIDHRCIRSGYSTLRYMQGNSVATISTDLDHEHSDTTDVHYLSDAPATEHKDKDIRNHQDTFIEMLIDYARNGVEHPTLTRLKVDIAGAKGIDDRTKIVAEAAQNLGVTEADIVRIIAPNADVFVAACLDALQPTWPGHEEYIKPGEPCSCFNKCGQCDKAMFFPESLPFIARRILDVEALRPPTLSHVDYESGGYPQELVTWYDILGRWRDQGQVADAWRRAREGLVHLPVLTRVVR